MSTRSIRGVALTLLTLFSLVVTTVLGVNSSPAAGTGSLPLHRCSNIQLDITPVRSNGGAGHMGAMYRVHNLTTRTCTLEGYPSAEMLDTRFRSLLTHVDRGLGHRLGEPAARLVTLIGGGDAYFVLEWSQMPIGEEPCRSAKYVLVTPPNDRLADVTYAFPGGSTVRLCSPQITISPVASAPFNF